MITLEAMQNTPHLMPLTVPQMDEISPLEINAAVKHILDSSIFKKAHRMCRLLRYLIENTLSASKHSLNEYAIGMDVFDRNPATYYPGDDPIVRVQVGRLRKRLKSYYADLSNQPKIAISIPLGSYMPVIECRAEQSTTKVRKMESYIAILPLHYIADDFHGRVFTRRMNGMISEQLNQAFGAKLLAYAALVDVVNTDTRNSCGYFLEGSVLSDGKEIQANIRIIDVRSHAIMYSQQLIQPVSVNMAAHEQMANQICEVVLQFMQLASAMPDGTPRLNS